MAFTTPDKIASISVPKPFQDSTLKKHEWVQPMYEQWSQMFFPSIKSFPLSDNIAVFIKWCGFVANYGKDSISDVIVPSLKRIHAIKCDDEPIAPAVNRAIAAALHEINRDLAPSGEKKNACLLADVVKIIAAIPPGLTTRSEEASLLLVSVSTGARATTCEAVKIGDIVNLITSSTGSTIAQLTFQKTKGNNHWNHTISIEGYPEQYALSDPVYWLQQHLKENFNLSLLSFNSWNRDHELLDSKLWHWKTDAMSSMLTDRSVAAGYPPGFFSFHCLRSGFICTALLNNLLSGNTNNVGILENTAFIAGWAPGGSAQQRYVKDAAIATMVSNRLATGSSSTSLTEAALATPEAFHRLPSITSTWKSGVNYQAFKKNVDTALDLRFPSLSNNQRTQLWIHAFNNWVKENQDLEDIAQEHTDKPYRARVVVGHEFISAALDADFTLLHSLVKSFLDIVVEFGLDDLVEPVGTPVTPHVRRARTP
jgi:hypothetical protein